MKRYVLAALICISLLVGCGDNRDTPHQESGIVDVNSYTSVESVHDPVTGRDFRCIYYYAYKKGGVWCYEVRMTP